MRKKHGKAGPSPAADDIETEALSVANCAAEWVRAPGSQAERAILYLHGGGLCCRLDQTPTGSLAGEISRCAQAGVLLVDYRLAPEAPFSGRG